MTTNTDSMSELERRTRAVLEESLVRIDARTRSRLNQARHAALEAAQRSRSSAWHGFRLVPVTGSAVAAAALAVVLIVSIHRPVELSKGEGAQPSSLEMLDLLADDDGLNLAEDYDHSFYEWAADQGDANGATGGEASDGATGG